MKTWLVISGIIFGLMAILSLIPIKLLPLMTPGSGNGSVPDGVNLFAYSLISFPIVVLISIVGAWSFYYWSVNKSNELDKSMILDASQMISLLPLVNIFFMFLGMTQMW